MKTLPPAISDAERAVHAFKHDMLVRVMAHIVRLALHQGFISPNDVPEDIVDKEHRQGVASNACNALVAIEVIERLPLVFTDASLNIFAGRTMNKNESAKGRMVAVYRLRNRALALTWLERNEAGIPAGPPVQLELTGG